MWPLEPGPAHGTRFCLQDKIDKFIWIDLWINLMFSDFWKTSMFSCYSSICTNYRILECSALYFFSFRHWSLFFFWDYVGIHVFNFESAKNLGDPGIDVTKSSVITIHPEIWHERPTKRPQPSGIRIHCYSTVPTAPWRAFNIAFWRSLQRSAVRWTGSFFSSGSACTDDQTFLSKINNWDLIHANHQLIHQLLIHQLSLWWHPENHQLMHQFLEEVEGPHSLVALSDLRAISVAPPPALMKVDTERPKV